MSRGKSTLQLKHLQDQDSNSKKATKDKKRLRIDKKTGKPIKWWVYCLTNLKRTYVGKTNHLKRRLRQHRGEIVGGAKFTKRFNIPNQPWRYAFILNTDNESDALKIEWAMHKNPAARSRGTGTRCQKRLNGLLNLIQTTTSATKSATPWKDLAPIGLVCNSSVISTSQLDIIRSNPSLFRLCVKE